ncbi:hypothetical protein L6R52_42170, partial [Myxococcota bacterium]|nr:hypothetical protein [Myxococcota bacterium]
MDIEKLDLRTRERYLRKGIISQKDVDTYLESLHDSAENADMVDYDRVFAEQDRAEKAEAAAPARVEEP